MPKLNKPSVRFAFIKKKRFPFQTVRLCLTYKGKRLYQTDEGNDWYGVDLSQFNSDGTLLLKKDNPDADGYRMLSSDLRFNARVAIMIAEEAEKKGVWDKLTSKEFSNLFEYGRGILGAEEAGTIDLKKDVCYIASKLSYKHCWQLIIGKSKK